jgi:F-type H+-transporting ATPase subunit b
MEALGALGIDFKLLIAQIINFGILLAILVKILYRPILKALEERKQRIEESLKKAEEIDRKVITVEDECKAKLEETRKNVDTLMEDAKTDAEKLRKEIIASGEAEAARLKSSAETQIQTERSRIYDDAQKQAGKIALILMAKAFQYDKGEDFYKESVDKALKDIEKI